MRKAIGCILAVLSLSLLTGLARASTPQDILNLFPYTTTTPLTLINANTGIAFKNYQNPSQTQIDNIRSLLTALDANDVDNTTLYVSKLNMKVVRIQAPHNDLLFFSVPNQGCAICLFWRAGAMKVPGDSSTYANPVDPLVLEVPHQGIDGTGPAADAFIRQTHTRIMILNAASPHCDNHAPPCEPNSHLSDAAHSYGTLFNKTHVILANLYPDSFFIQLHGESAKYLNVYNCYNTSFGAGPRFFMHSIPDNFPQSFWSHFAFATSNSIARQIGDNILDIVEANALNGGNQCSKGNHDAGRFLFLEMGESIRLGNFSSGWQKRMAATFNETMVKWVQR